MARIKLKLGENEIEIDSRDFYVDNNTLGEIIDNLSNHLPENQAKIVYDTQTTQTQTTQTVSPESSLRLKELQSLVDDLNKQNIQQRLEISQLRKTK